MTGLPLSRTSGNGENEELAMNRISEEEMVARVRRAADENGWLVHGEGPAPPPSPGRLRRLWLRWKWRKNWPSQDHEAPRA